MHDWNQLSTLSRPRLHALDGIRGLCAIAIMLYHVLLWNGVALFQIGTFGVYLFYVLSGFSLWYVYAHRTVTLDLLKTFFTARVARIVPLYLAVCLLIVVLRFHASGASSVFNADFISRFLLNMTFLFGVALPQKSAIVPGGWSIGIEWVFYLAFPLFLLFARRMWVMLALVIGGLILNQAISMAVLSGITLDAQWDFYTQFPTFLVYFAAGILAAELHDRWQHHHHHFSHQFGQLLARLVLLACIVLIFCYPAISAEDYLKGFHSALLVAAAWLAMMAAALLTDISRAEIRICTFLAEISFGVYLLHFFVYNAVQALLISVDPDYSLATLVGISTGGTMILAYFVYRWFEGPARAWINHRLVRV